MTTTLLDLPLPAFVEISDHVSIIECRRLVMTCKSLWTSRHSIERARRTAIVQSNMERSLLRQEHTLRPLPRLVNLNLGDAVDDTFLMEFDWSVDFPALREISMEGSLLVHGAAVRVALQNHPSLQRVNVVFCPFVEYVDALRLRDSLVQSNAIIRRLPKEMCGMVETNFKDDRKATKNATLIALDHRRHFFLFDC
jgi:hypothetical protein